MHINDAHIAKILDKLLMTPIWTIAMWLIINQLHLNSNYLRVNYWFPYIPPYFSHSVSSGPSLMIEFLNTFLTYTFTAKFVTNGNWE